MLCRNALVTLLVASISILRAGAVEEGEQIELPNELQTPVYKSGSILEASTVQKDNIYNTGLKNLGSFGSIVQEKTKDFESAARSLPPALEEGEKIELPNELQTPVYKSGSILEALTVQKDNIYNTGLKNLGSFGSIVQEKTKDFESAARSLPPALEEGEKIELPNELQTPVYKSGSILEALTVQKDNIYNTGLKNLGSFGSIVQEKTKDFESAARSLPPALEEGEKIELPNELQTPVYKSRNILEALTHNTGLEDLSSLDSIVQVNKKVFDSAARSLPSIPNGQTKLSSDNLILFLYFWVVLKICSS